MRKQKTRKVQHLVQSHMNIEPQFRLSVCPDYPSFLSSYLHTFFPSFLSFNTVFANNFKFIKSWEKRKKINVQRTGYTQICLLTFHPILEPTHSYYTTSPQRVHHLFLESWIELISWSAPCVPPSLVP